MVGIVSSAGISGPRSGSPRQASLRAIAQYRRHCHRSNRHLCRDWNKTGVAQLLQWEFRTCHTEARANSKRQRTYQPVTRREHGRRISCYHLNSHLAGSVVALELLEHLEATYHRCGSRGTRGLDAATGDWRESHAQACAWLAEKMTDLKLRLDDPKGASLQLFESLEALWGSRASDLCG